ncbi:Translin [Coniochaeta ligniaria NRRL 30616]|uniref:Translin n=1 Tax=Coniochaeta ligniaria NRRL 30616 TaxID=1408157 RepID=A0A1J7IM37_9PEZI|nr:Translin [Coniochaeta ligniaria NRRL 30616]
MAPSMIDPQIFDQLKSKLDEDTKVQKSLSEIIDQLETQIAYAQGLLSRIHGTPRAEYPALLQQVEVPIRKEIEHVGELSKLASNHPYYRYNYRWSHKVQDAISTVLLTAWIGGMATATSPGELGRLLTLEQVGDIFQVPVNLKDRDAFHITTEEYLLAVTNLTDELSRLAVNAVTLGDRELAVRISAFVKDIHAGFQLLNLKNDILRKRVDSVKYHVKKVEDVVYDLTLRNLIPVKEQSA